MASSSNPGSGFGFPPPDTGNFLLNWISRALILRDPLERRIDPFFRPPSTGSSASRCRSWRTALINLRRKDEGLRAGRGAHPAGRGGSTSRTSSTRSRAQMRGLWKPGYFERGGNTKTHGIVRAEFTVRDDLPEHMRRGIFAEPRTYRAWVRFSGPGPVRHARHRRRRLHEHEHQAHGRAGAEAARRRAVHAGPARRLDADVRHARHARQRAAPALEPAGTRRSSTSSTCATRTSSTRSCSCSGRRRRRARSRASTSAACPYLLGEGQAMQYSFRTRRKTRTPRAAPAAAPARQLPARRDGRDARRARTSSSTSCSSCRPIRS